MDVMMEKAAGVLVVQLIQVDFTAVGEGGVADIVTQGDGLDQIQVQVQRATDGTGNAGNKLNVEAAAS